MAGFPEAFTPFWTVSELVITFLALASFPIVAHWPHEFKKN